MRLIDADQFEAVGYKVPEGYDPDSYCAGVEYLAEKIDAAPTIEPERKRGNWIGIDDEPCETFECDRCGFVLEDWIQGAFYNFCPNCGADMRGGQNGN